MAIGSTENSEHLILNEENILKINEEMQSRFVGMFLGVPVRVDPNLKDNEWYCLVSPEVYQQIKIKVKEFPTHREARAILKQLKIHPEVCENCNIKPCSMGRYVFGSTVVGGRNE